MAGKIITSICPICSKSFDFHLTRKRSKGNKYCSPQCFSARMKEKAKPIAQRFWPKVRKTETCWLWMAQIMPTGYGCFWDGTRQQGAHRVSYELHNGNIPNGLFVLHKCDVRNCVRPDHLFLGTTQDNTRDRDTKGRQARGERSGAHTKPHTVVRGSKHYRAKLTEIQIIEIRKQLADGNKAKDIARQVGASKDVVYKIKYHKIWKHVP